MPLGVHASRWAFSTFELIIAVVIVALLAAMAVPRFGDALRTRQLEAVVQRLEADIALAQRDARTRSQPATIEFDLDDHRYTLAGIIDPDRSGNSDYTIELATDGYGAELLSADFGGETTLTFDGFGQPATGGTIIVRHAGLTRTLTIAPDTGRVTRS